MTISSENRKAGPFTGNGSTTSFPFTFKVFAKSDLQVVRRDANGVEHVLVLDSDYSVTLNADQDNDPGGAVTFPLAGSALPSTQTLTIAGALDYLQPADITNQGGFYPQVVEDALDRAVILVQQLKTLLNGAIQLPISTPAGVSTQLPVPEANKILAWNQAANALQNLSTTELATLVAYGTAKGDIFTGDGATTQFTLASNPGALNNLDVSIGGVTQLPGVDYSWNSGTLITFTSAPLNGEKIFVRYMQALPFGDVDANDVYTTLSGELSATATWSAVPAVAGNTGLATALNQQQQVLANRTQYLKQLTEGTEFNVLAYGAGRGKTTTENRTAMQAAITAADTAGGGVVVIPQGIDYGFQNTNMATYPSFAGCANDIVVKDFGIGDADGSGNKAGAQVREFTYTAQTSPVGMHDGNGRWIYGAWHPYNAVMCTANLSAPGDPSRTAFDNYRASYMYGADGYTTWLLGQGGLAGAGYTREELLDFRLEKYAIAGDTLGDFAPLIIQRKTGNISLGGAGTHAPPAALYLKNASLGYWTALFESLTTTTEFRLRNSNGSSDDVSLKNVSGDYVVNIPSQGDALTVKKATRNVGIGATGAYRLDVADTQSGGYVANIKNLSSANGNGVIVDSASAAGVGWSFARLFADNQADEKFKFRGDGNGFCDGAWTGGGADYAEYFEWLDGNPNGEDRRGLSVTLVGSMIREAQPGDDVIGVVSGNPSVIGDAAWSAWAGKYLRDEYGTVITEDYEAVEWAEKVLMRDAVAAIPARVEYHEVKGPDGSVVAVPVYHPGRKAEAAEYAHIKHSYPSDGVPPGVVVPDDAVRTIAQRSVLNPDFDPSASYTPRELRKEWAAVGMIGKLRVRKGQQVGNRWIKMREISTDVDEWLVR